MQDTENCGRLCSYPLSAEFTTYHLVYWCSSSSIEVGSDTCLCSSATRFCHSRQASCLGNSYWVFEPELWQITWIHLWGRLSEFSPFSLVYWCLVVCSDCPFVFHLALTLLQKVSKSRVFLWNYWAQSQGTVIAPVSEDSLAVSGWSRVFAGGHYWGACIILLNFGLTVFHWHWTPLICSVCLCVCFWGLVKLFCLGHHLNFLQSLLNDAKVISVCMHQLLIRSLCYLLAHVFSAQWLWLSPEHCLEDAAYGF